MFETVFSFAHRNVVGGRVVRGTVTQVDADICRAEVDVDGARCVFALDKGDCTESLREIITLRDGVARIECDAELDQRRIVALHLCVEPQLFAARVGHGGVRSEEHLINLARTVWREARVVEEEDDESMEENEEGYVAVCDAWNDTYALFPHQTRTVRWMRGLEARFPMPLAYAGNLRVADGWYVDTECECVTTHASVREASLRGGVCANDPGTGKTAVALRLVAEDCCAARDASTSTGGEARPSRATLLVVPVNLVSQWNNEIRKFINDSRVRVLTVVRTQDLRGVTLQHLCNECDVVLTTMSFLRTSKGYLDMIDAALGGRPRTRASLSAWARQKNHTEPVLEAVAWRRVIIDEIHDAFENPKSMRVLNLFPATTVLWGLTGTPVVDTDQAQALYALLTREKAHHPNLLAALVARAVRVDSEERGGGASARATPTRHLERVRLSAEERVHLARATETDVEAQVRLATFVDGAPGAEEDGTDVEAQFHRMRAAQRVALVARIESHEHTLKVLEQTRDHLQTCDVEMARATLDATLRDIARQRDLCDAARARLAHVDGTSAEVALARATSSPRATRSSSTALEKEKKGIGTKVTEIGNLLHSLAPHAVILFVQWKSMMRGVRAYLKGIGLRVLHLDGNASHRASTLAEFTQGGVLLLCLEESFSGLHLSHVRTIVFAHAIVGDHGTVARLERQAIARCVRQGQDGDVQVYSFVVADSAEEDLWHETHSGHHDGGA